MWIVDAHRDDGKRFIAPSDEKLTAFLELERAICLYLLTGRRRADPVSGLKGPAKIVLTLLVRSGQNSTGVSSSATAYTPPDLFPPGKP